MNSNELRKQVGDWTTFDPGAIEAFFQLVDQPDLIWNDLLLGLAHRGLIAEISAIRLHHELGISVPASGFIMERSFWDHELV